MADEEPSSPVIDNGIVLKGLHRALPGLETFLRERLANEKLSPEVEEQLSRLVQQLDKLESDVNKDASADKSSAPAIITTSTSVSSTEMEEDGPPASYQGFLVQGVVQMNNLLQWNRRWCVLLANDHILRAYAMRSRTLQKPLWELDLLGCRVAPVDPRDAGDKTSAFKIIPPAESGLTAYLLRTYEESEMRRSMKVFALTTGEQHTEQQLTEYLAASGSGGGAGSRALSTSPMPPRSASAASQTAVLPSGEVFEIDDGDGLYAVPPPTSSRVMADDTYDVPPSRPSAGPSRSASDFDLPTEEQLRNAPSAAVSPPDEEDQLEAEMDSNYSELTFREGKTAPGANVPRTSLAPGVPVRTSQMLVPSHSDASSTADRVRPATTAKERSRDAKDSYASAGEGVYESLPQDLDDVHLSDSNTDDGECIYEPLDVDDASDGYTSSGSVNSLMGWFKRGTNERKSGAKKKKKERRHRLSRSVTDLVDPDQDGYLAKRSGAGLTWRRRWCVLKDMCLYYFRSKDDNVARNAIILPGWRLVTVSDEVKRPFTFKLSHEGMTDYFFSASTSDEYATWIAVMERCLRVPNGNNSIPYGPPAIKPKTRADQEATNLFQAVDALAHGQWDSGDTGDGDYNVPPSRGGPEPDQLYDTPRQNAGMLASAGSVSAAQPTADPRKGSGGSSYLDVPPPVPAGPRPSPGTSRQPPPSLPSGEDVYNSISGTPRGMRRQDSEYDDDQYLNPTEIRSSGRGTPVLPEPLPNRNKPITPPPGGASAATAQADPDAPDAGTQFQRGGLYGSLSRLMRRASKGKADRIIKPTSVRIGEGEVEGVISRRGALHMWSPHFCRLKGGVFLCYKGDDKNSAGDAPELEYTKLRMLSQKVGNADREVKKANSIYIVKQPRRGQSPNMSRAFFLQCDNDQDYHLWITSLQKATEISVQAVGDATAIHTAGRQAPATMDLQEAQRIHSPAPTSAPLTGHFAAFTDTGPDAGPGNDTYDIPPSAVSASLKIPSWLQEEVSHTEPATGAAATAASAPVVKGIPVVGNPLWWGIISTPPEGAIKGPLSVKKGTMAATRSWQPHWCQVSDGHLRCYQQKSDTQSVLDLKLGDQLMTHAPERGRPFCFNVFVSERRAVCLSAEIRQEMDGWMAVLLAARSSALAPDQQLNYGGAPEFTALAPRPTVARDGAAEVEGAGYYHDVIQPDRVQHAHKESGSHYYPPEPFSEYVAKAPLEKAQPSATLPPSYRRDTGISPAPANPGAAGGGGQVQEGYLQKRSGPSLWHRRYCFLQDTKLHVYSQKGSQQAIQVLSLTECGMDVSSKDGKKDAFKLTPLSPHPRVYFQAANARERTRWLTAIGMAIQSANAAKESAAGTQLSRKRFSSFRRPKSNVIDLSTLKNLEQSPRKSRGLIGRLRSLSQQNVSRSSRHQDLVDPAYDSRADPYGYNPQESTSFQRGAVSLGHGEFKRDRGGKGAGARSTASRSTSGVLILNYGQGEATLWCEVSNGRLAAFLKPEDSAPTFATELSGARIVLSSSQEGRVITLEGGPIQKSLLIRVTGQAAAFDEWVNVLQAASAGERPLKRSWSTRLRRSFRRPPRDRPARGRAAAGGKRHSEPAVSSREAARPPLDLATTANKGGPPSAPLGSRPLPRPPGQLPNAPAHGMDTLLPGYASKLTDDLNALTSAADNDDTEGGRRDKRGNSLPSDTREKDGRKQTSGASAGQPRTLPPRISPDEIFVPPPSSSSQGLRDMRKGGKSKTPPPTAPKSRSPAPRMADGGGGGGRSNSANSLDSTGLKRTPPPAPRRKDSIGELAAATPPPSIKNVQHSPRPRANTNVQMSAPPPPPPSSAQSPPAAYSDLLKEYEDKARAVNAQAAEKRAALTKDRVDLVRQQVDVEEQIQSCTGRLAAAATGSKGGKGREEPYEIKRQKLELQSKFGWVEGKIQRIDDQILRVSTDLATTIDRLEKERNQRVERMNGGASSSKDVESAM